MPVTFFVSNRTGTKTDDLKITYYIINYFLSDKYAYGGELQEKAFSSYVKDVCLKASVYYLSLIHIWRLPTMSTSAASGCVALWALR